MRKTITEKKKNIIQKKYLMRGKSNTGERRVFLKELIEFINGIWSIMDFKKSQK